MPRLRFLLAGLLKLCLAIGCVIGAVVTYRLLLDPFIDKTLQLGSHASSIVRRVNIFAFAVLSYWAFTHYYERRRASELAVRPGWTLLAGAAGALSIGITILVLFAAGFYQVQSFRGFSGSFDVLGPIWIAAVLEELVFRAILFRILEERIGTRPALFASAVIFCAAHTANNGVRWVTLITVTVVGLMWALVFVASRNLWVVAALHCCWNATIFLSGLPLSGEDWRLQAPFEIVVRGSVFWTGGAFGPEDSVLNIVTSAALCVLLWRIGRRGRPNDPALPAVP
jgi:hypothetical protein